MKLKREQIGAIYYAPKGGKIQWIELSDELTKEELAEIYRNAPTLFEESDDEQEKQAKPTRRKK